MRITNAMISNTMMLNIQRNVTNVNGLYNQITTGKKIQLPSDDPIVAARALKFRTNVKETEQYQKNVAQGTSWMEVTEQGFKNVTSIVERIRELCVQGASDSYSYDDRKKIATDIQSLTEQIGLEMNISYAGRYVYSGFRTDKPPVLTEDVPSTYNIQQHFGIGDVQNTLSYQRTDNVTPPDVQQVNILKLPYTDVDNLALSIGGTPATVTELSVTDPTAYTPGANDVYYIRETGELVLGASVVTDIGTNTIDVTYDKSNLKVGELNPEVYFDCTVDGKVYTMNNQTMSYEFGNNTTIGVNSLAKNVYTDKMFSDLKNFVDIIQNVQLSSESALSLSGKSKEEIDAQLTEEKQKLQGVLQDRFKDMLQELDNHMKVVSKENADLGSKMARLELIDNRLQEDELTFTKLLSENEDADYANVIMLLNTAESVYQASLQVGAKIIQTTLANFIN